MFFKKNNFKKGEVRICKCVFKVEQSWLDLNLGSDLEDNKTSLADLSVCIVV